MAANLAEYLTATAERFPDRTAVVDPDGTSLTYAELDRRSDALARFLVQRGIALGDRVGVVLPKSLRAVISLFGIMKAGAAYVPVDWTAPAERGRRILADCRVRAVIADHRSLATVPKDEAADLAAVIVSQPARSPASSPSPSEPSGELLAHAIPFDEAIESSGPELKLRAGREDLAYILYTSGSTGVPKGVMLSHENALSFVDWCSSVFDPSESDRFSSHAPFHFDLSVLDVYVAIKHGAELHLIPDNLGRSPKELGQFIADRRITVWYSTPSILTLLLQFGRLDTLAFPDLRLVLFAGEVFPVKHLREVQRAWPRPTYYNLYGPTETNVCTFARIPAKVPDDREVPYPIGFACSHCEPLVLDEHLEEVTPGEEGLLYIAGPSVFHGYWNRPVENASAFLTREGRRWYNTGDLVRWSSADGFQYAGRKDRMVKRRGYRIELGEIERALYAHREVQEAAVLSMPDQDAGVKIVAVLSCQTDKQPSLVDLKTFLGTKVPAYMSPDRFVFRAGLPKTSTDKIDYQRLRGEI